MHMLLRSVTCRCAAGPHRTTPFHQHLGYIPSVLLSSISLLIAISTKDHANETSHTAELLMAPQHHPSANNDSSNTQSRPRWNSTRWREDPCA